MNIITLRRNLEIFGGQGSGNFGHQGRPGEVGGSGEGGGEGGGGEKQIATDRAGRAIYSSLGKNPLSSKLVEKVANDPKKLDRIAIAYNPQTREVLYGTGPHDSIINNIYPNDSEDNWAHFSLVPYKNSDGGVAIIGTLEQSGSPDRLQGLRNLNQGIKVLYSKENFPSGVYHYLAEGGREISPSGENYSADFQFQVYRIYDDMNYEAYS